MLYRASTGRIVPSCLVGLTFLAFSIIFVGAEDLRCEANVLPSLHSPHHRHLTQQYRESYTSFAHDTQGSIFVTQEDAITERGVGDFVEVQKSSKDGTSGVKFEKTLAAQIEKALAKEFTDARPRRCRRPR